MTTKPVPAKTKTRRVGEKVESGIVLATGYAELTFEELAYVGVGGDFKTSNVYSGELSLIYRPIGEKKYSIEINGDEIWYDGEPSRFETLREAAEWGGF